MANFILAHKETQVNEGGYASADFAASIGDRGGETYRGMSRNFTGTNPVWNYIDNWKSKYGVPSHNSIIPDNTINSLVDQFYKSQIWDPIKLDNVNSQGVANVLFDIGTNSGPTTAIKSVQSVLKVPIDGVVGPVTLGAINRSNSNQLIQDLINYRKTWLVQNQSGKSYLTALLNRVDSYNKYIIPGLAIGLPLILGGSLLFFFLNKHK
jgi:lysozyme family protein